MVPNTAKISSTAKLEYIISILRLLAGFIQSTCPTRKLQSTLKTKKNRHLGQSEGNQAGKVRIILTWPVASLSLILFDAFVQWLEAKYSLDEK
jgi:hypothetical protein